jgi:hypothetical protein
MMATETAEAVEGSEEKRERQGLGFIEGMEEFEAPQPLLPVGLYPGEDQRPSYQQPH